MGQFGFDSMNLEGFGMEEQLQGAIEKKEYARAYALLRRQKEPLKKQYAGRCLAAALQCTEKLFRQVLEHCEPGIHTATLNWRDSYRKQTFQASGTILLLAAALDRPRHAEILLKEYGYDCNSASLEDSQALLEFTDFRISRPRNVRKSGAEGGSVSFWEDGKGSWPGVHAWQVSCCTPLAAAVACGAMSTTALLLKQPGVWKEESSAVCRATMMALNGDWRQKDCATQVFPLEGNAYLFQDKKDVLAGWNLQPGCFVDFCSLEDLRTQLKSGLCTERDIRDVLSVLEENRYPSVHCMESKLLAVARYYPDLCRDPQVLALILHTFVQAYEEDKKPDMRLLNCWKRLTGPVADISGMHSQLVRLSSRKLKEVLLLLKEGKQELVLDANALVIGHWPKFTGLNYLLKYVTIRPGRVPKGISSFLACLLASGNLKLVRQAMEMGVLQRESKEEMLAYLQERGGSPALKPLVLAMPRGEQRKENWIPETRGIPCWFWSAEWSQVEEEQANQWREELWNKELSREECLRRMLTMQSDANFKECLGWKLNFGDWDDRMVLDDPKWGELVTNDMLGAACIGSNPAMLEAMLDMHPEYLFKRMELSFSGGWCREIEGTPLCLAAAMGRTEQVRILLERGVEVDELNSSCRSQMKVKRGGTEEEEEHAFFAFSRYECMAVTPLLAAILMGEEETARMLLEHGAVCDISSPYAWKLLTYSTPKALDLAARLPGIGYEKVPAEQVEALRVGLQAATAA